MSLTQLIKLKFIFRASNFHYFNIFSSGHNSIWVQQGCQFFIRLANTTRTQYKICGLELRGQTYSIKYVGLRLNYIILYSYLDTT